MHLILQTPNPQSLHLSLGDHNSIISGSISSIVGNTATLVLSIVADPHVSMSLDGVNFSNSVQWTVDITASTVGYSQTVIFRMINNPGGTTPCGLVLKATVPG